MSDDVMLRIAVALERIADSLENDQAMSGMLDAALQPATVADEQYLDSLDWFRATDGGLMVRENGVARNLNQVEREYLEGTLKHKERR